MKRFLPYLIVLLAGLWLGLSWMVPKPPAGDFDIGTFSRLPVLEGGRIKPLDTVARNSLLIMSGKQTLRLANGNRMAASRWLADVLFNAPVADAYPVFAISNQEVLGMFGWPQADKRYCTFAEFQPYLAKIDEEGQAAARMEAPKRLPFHTAIHNLRNSLVLYQQLKASIQPDNTADFAAEINAYAKAVAVGVTALKQGSENLDKGMLALLKSSVARYESQAQATAMLVDAVLDLQIGLNLFVFGYGFLVVAGERVVGSEPLCVNDYP